MSFSGTPLGQGRRLDHHTFLNKPTLAQHHHTFHPRPNILHPPNNSIPASYAYGAPTAGSRSPPKPTSTSSRSAPTLDSADNQDETALVRYARLKREQSLNTSLQPEKWTVKDTSVNIAAAFNQAASTSYEMHPSNPNNSWASGSHANLAVPRSTSVEYEKETHSTSSRRLAPPPNRLTQRSSHKPLSKQTSGLTHVSDSEAEDQSHSTSLDQSARGKSPLGSAFDFSKRLVGSATSFYLRQRSTEPADTSAVPANGRDSSYDYASEEQEYRALQRQMTEQELDQDQQPPTKKNTHRRNRMSTDNKAYRPTASDLEESDDNISDDGKKRRKRVKKKDFGPGTLTSLPVAGYDKRRKRRKGTKITATGEVEDDEGSSSGSEERSSAQLASVGRGSVTRTSVPPPSRTSVPRNSVPPEFQFVPTDASMDVESGLETSGLETIHETDEAPLVDGIAHTSDRPSRSFSVGGFLGLVVNRVIRLSFGTLAFILRIITTTFLILGRILGSAVDILFQKPIALVSNINPRPFIILSQFAIVGLAIYIAWFKLYDPLIDLLPSRIAHRPYYAPESPITNLDEFTVRLKNIEAALSGLSLDHQRARAQQDLEARAHGEVVNRIYALEARLREETRRSADAESHHQAAAGLGLTELRQELEVLQGQLRSIESTPRETVHLPSPTNDAEAQGRLRLLEERLGSVEGGVKEAIELSKQSPPRSSDTPTWWSKLKSGVTTDTGLTIKASDGSDVTSLISHLVDSAVARVSTQDVISRADFALHSAGARPIPHLTSYTLEMRPTTFRGRVLGWMTGHGREVGRSPITALHQDIHSGLCWPMSGDFGQLGVALASPAFISDFTVDHVAKEVAFDVRTAPRDMEVWGLVEGKENLEKVTSWRAERAAQRAEKQQHAEESGIPFEADEPAEDIYPPMLPQDEPFIRLASFTYDVTSPSNIQTFPIRQEVRELGVDFGIVVLVIKNNWGKKEYTCLYRFRVHGEQLGGMPQPVDPQAQDP
ncbi:hypothetical protein V8B97DRAFT_1870072 [Scleroderma yunnanense]